MPPSRPRPGRRPRRGQRSTTARTGAPVARGGAPNSPGGGREGEQRAREAELGEGLQRRGVRVPRVAVHVRGASRTRRRTSPAPSRSAAGSPGEVERDPPVVRAVRSEVAGEARPRTRRLQAPVARGPQAVEPVARPTGGVAPGGRDERRHGQGGRGDAGGGAGAGRAARPRVARAGYARDERREQRPPARRRRGSRERGVAATLSPGLPSSTASRRPSSGPDAATTATATAASAASSRRRAGERATASSTPRPPRRRRRGSARAARSTPRRRPRRGTAARRGQGSGSCAANQSGGSAPITASAAIAFGVAQRLGEPAVDDVEASSAARSRPTAPASSAEPVSVRAAAPAARSEGGHSTGSASASAGERGLRGAAERRAGIRRPGGRHGAPRDQPREPAERDRGGATRAHGRRRDGEHAREPGEVDRPREPVAARGAAVCERPPDPQRRLAEQGERSGRGRARVGRRAAGGGRVRRCVCVVTAGESGASHGGLGEQS